MFFIEHLCLYHHSVTQLAFQDMYRRRILMNCARSLARTLCSGLQRYVTCEVDTGWVTDMAPGGVGAVAASHETWVGPPLDEEDHLRSCAVRVQCARAPLHGRMVPHAFLILSSATSLTRRGFCEGNSSSSLATPHFNPYLFHSCVRDAALSRALHTAACLPQELLCRLDDLACDTTRRYTHSSAF